MTIKKELITHLTKTIMYRRHRLMYIRRHQGKLAHERDQEIQSPFEAVEPDHLHNTGQPKGTSAEPHPGTAKASPGEGYSETAPSTINTKVYNQYGNVEQTKPSTVAGSISSSWIGKIVYPAPPTDKDKSSHVICPFCFQEFPAKAFEKSHSWKYDDIMPHIQNEEINDYRSHLDKDLEHYVCISDECKHCLHYFDNFNSWFEHMNETHTEAWSQFIHSTMWRCVFHHDNAPDSFQTVDELYNHLKQVHRENFNSGESLALAQKSQVLEPRKPDICPLCNESIALLIDQSVPPTCPEPPESRDIIGSAMPENNVPEKNKTRRVAFADQADSEELDRGSQSSSTQSAPTPGVSTGCTALRLKMAKHVAGHLKSISFLSLRGLELDAVDDFATGNSSVQAIDEGECGSEAGWNGSVTFGLDEQLSFEDIADGIVLIEEEEDRENRELCLSLEPPHNDPEWSFVVRTHSVNRWPHQNPELANG